MYESNEFVGELAASRHEHDGDVITADVGATSARAGGGERWMDGTRLNGDQTPDA